MKITFLGTAASEGIPAVWCNCPICSAARLKGGRDIRTRCQVMIDDCLLVDFPMDTYMHALTNGLDLSKIEAVLITHSHMDHFYPREFMLHGFPYAYDMTRKSVYLYGNSTVIAAYERDVMAKMNEDVKTSVYANALHAFDCVVTESGYTVTPLPAKHTVGEECLLYAIERDGKSALILNDTGMLPIFTYEKAASLGLKFDLVSFDCTYGGEFKDENNRHMGLPNAISERKKMQKCGILKENAKFVVTHFSHNGKLNYDELCKRAEPENFIVAYDGMVVEI